MKTEITRELLLLKLDESRRRLQMIQQELVAQSADNSCLQDIAQWFEELETDLKTARLIPESFLDKLANDIQRLELSAISDMDVAAYVSNYKNDPSSYPFPNFLLIHDISASYTVYKTIHFVTENTVIVGSNGCGKSSLAEMLQSTLMQRNGIVIPAQKLLIIPTLNNVPMYTAFKEKYDNHQREYYNGRATFSFSSLDNIPYDAMLNAGNDFAYVLGALLSERVRDANKQVRLEKAGTLCPIESRIDKVMSIWNTLIPQRTLFCTDDNQLMVKHTETTYEAHKMSDGEKVMFYLIGRVLLAPDNGIIIVDEPEMHLHKSIVNKLWDSLESARPSCTFVYLTHDLEFATSRQAKKYWINDFIYPSSWDIHPLSDNERDIPEELLLKLVGSKKKILFCEGAPGSYDAPIFEVLFPHLTITPVKSCKNVIEYTRAFNKINGTTAHAFGLIDHDYREEEQLTKLATEDIYSYDVAEIENLFLVEQFLRSFAIYKHENQDRIENIKSRVFELLRRNKEQQASQYVSGKINFVFNNSNMTKGTTKDQVKANYNDFCHNIDVEGWYNHRINEIDDVLNTRNYQKAILLYNNKGLKQTVEAEWSITKFHDKAIEFIRDQESEEAEKARVLLRGLFPQTLNRV